KRKSEDDEERMQDTKGEALSYVSKKAKNEDEKQRSAGYHLMIPVIPPQFSAAKCHHAEKLANHIHSQLGLAILPTDVKLITKPEDLYQWSILTPGKAALFNKQLSKHSTGAYIDLCNGVGVHFKAVLGEGTADYEQEMRLITTSIAFDALEKKWRERFNAELAIREALEIEMMGIKGENAELLTEIKALRKAEATQTQELDKAREILMITSSILQERESKACEDSQKITHAAAYLKLGSNPGSGT
ncbi:hypothetical protein V502_03492, partial [Pseudogymnoascus sp. VKM F-4520 (FW-2644)]